MNTFEPIINDYYIAKKASGKEQIFKYYQKGKTPRNETIYYGYYGLHGYHELIATEKTMRELTAEERELLSEKKYYSLPQKFYQTHPEDQVS